MALMPSEPSPLSAISRCVAVDADQRTSTTSPCSQTLALRSSRGSTLLCEESVEAGIRVARSTRGDACSVQTMFSADGGPSPVTVKSRAPASGKVRLSEQVFGICAQRRKLTALDDEGVVPDQVFGSELRGFVVAHVHIGRWIGPIALQFASSSPDASTRLRASESASGSMPGLGSWRVSKPLCSFSKARRMADCT